MINGRKGLIGTGSVSLDFHFTTKKIIKIFHKNEKNWMIQKSNKLSLPNLKIKYYLELLKSSI